MKGLYTLLMGLLLVLSTQQLAGQNQTSVTVESTTASVGEEVCLQITGDNFDEILGFQFSLNYDPDALTFTSATGSVFFFQTVFIQNNSTDGTVRVLWNIFSNDALTMSDPFSLGEICFIVEQEAEIEISITGNPIPIDFNSLSGRVTDLNLTSGFINQGVLPMPTCTDGIQNGTETGIDCGGSCAPCMAMPTCTDGIQNGTETGIDCGGSCAPCMAMPTCTDGIQNGTETGIDCGGSCAPCMAMPTCTDGIQNGTETGIDCGGSCAPCMTNTDDVVFALNNTSGATGTQVCMNVTTQNFSALGAFQFSMAYDPAVLSYASVSNLAFTDINVVQPSGSPGQIRVSWVYFQPDNIGGNLPDGSTVFTLCFNVIQATGTTVSFSGSPIGIEAFDTNNTPLNVMTSNGTVNGGGPTPTCFDGIQNGTETGIDCGGSCAPCMAMPTCTDGIQNGTETGIDCGGSCAPCMTNTDDVVFALNNTSGATGTQVCMNVTTQNFSALGAFQFSMAYDPAVLSYASVSNLAFTDINVVQPSGSPGQIRVSWVYFQPDNIGGNLPDGSTVFTLCFNVIQATGTIVSFSGSPIGIEAFDTSNTPLNVMTTNGTVNGGGPTPTCFDGVQNGTETGIDCGGSCTPCATQNECTVNGDNLTLCLSDECGEAGELVCLDIEVSNFIDVTGMEFRLNYAAGNLNYVSKTDNPAFIGPVNVSEPMPGQLVVIWFDQTIEFAGIDIPNGETVMTFCFEAENEINTPINLSLINFTDPTGENILPVDVTPGSINGTDCGGVTPNCTDGIQNNGETGIDCGGPNCAACPVSCTDGIQNNGETGIDCGGPNCAPCMVAESCGENSSDLFFCAEDACGDVGSQVCFDVNTTNFTSIVGFEFRVIYPGANLQYVSGSGSSSLPGAPPIINPASDGEIRVLWFDQTSAFMGGTIAAGESVVNLCFNVETAATSMISLTQQSASSTTNSSVSPINVTPGSVNAPACSSEPETCTDGILNNGETQIDCGGPNCAACPPSCTDGIQNNGETGIDCGGPNCAPCMVAESCGENSSDLFFCAEDACGDVGSQVCFDVNTTNFTSIVGFEFRVIYPGANLQYVSGSGSSSLPGAPPIINPTSDGEIRVLWFDQTSAFMGGTIAAGESVVNLCFNVETAATSTISLTQQSASSTTNSSLSPVNVTAGSVNAPACSNEPETCTDGIQNNGETGIDCGGPNCAACPASCTDGIQNNGETGIDCGGPNCAPCMMAESCGENSSNLFFCAEDACGDVGSQVCFDVNTTNFTSIVGFEFRVIYPGGNLQYVSGSGSSSLPGAPPIINPVSDGEVRILWFDQTQAFMGGTIAAGESVVNLCFNVESAATSSITITQQSASSTTNSSLSPVNVTAGSVNAPACSNEPETCTDGIQNNGETGVDCGGPNCAACPASCTDGIQNNGETGIDCGGPNCAPCMMAESCGENSSNLFFCAEDACGDVGSQVCFDVNTTNFTSIVGFEFRVIYPGANLEYVSGSGSSSLPGAPPILNPVSDGEVRILWFDQTQAFMGGTIAAGESVVNLCFNVQAAGNSTINITQESASDVSGPLANVEITPGSVNGTGCDGPIETCADGILNNGETQVDCGGPNCAACPPSCTDGIQNGNETGVDCGGPDCAACPTDNQGDVTLSVPNGSGTIGQQTCLNITAADFTAVQGLDLVLTYNPALLQISSITATPNLPGFNSGSFTIPTPGTLEIDWMGANVQGLSDNATLFTVCFTIVGEGASTVNFTNTSTITDGNGMTFSVISTAGTVTGTNDFENLTFVMGSGIGAENSEVCLEVPVFNFVDVTSFSFTINYDPNKVTFNQLVGNTSFPPGGSFQVTNPVPGEVRVIWLYGPPDFAGITAPDGSIILSACFTVVEACETAIEITGNPTDITATDNQGETLDVDVFSGTINDEVPCGSCEPENLILDISNTSGSAGTEICLDVDVENFNGLTDLQFTLNYDPAVLEYAQVNNFGLGSISLANFTIGPAGRVIFDWSSPNSDGQSLVDDTAVFSVCFTILAVEETSVVFTNSPVPTLAQNGCGANVGVVPMNGVVNAGAPSGDDLTLQIVCQDAAVNQNVCVPIQTFNFTDMLGFQFSINYNPALLDFTGIAPNPALNVLVNESAAGQIRVSWTTPDGFSRDIPSGAILTELCFNVLSLDAAAVSFSSTPLPIEFTDDNGLVTPNLISCAINSDGGPQIDNVSITQPTCHDATDGTIELTVSGSTNLAFNWNPNPGMSTGPVLTNVSAGQTYTVEVVDLNTGESVISQVSVPSQTPFTPQITSVQGVSCFGEADGSITITPAGGTGPYIYDWSGNLQDNIPEQTDLDGGIYGVTVTDANGCARIFDNIQVAEAAEGIRIEGLINNISEQPGSITVGILNAALPTTCSWTGPQGFASMDCNLNGLTVPGTYCLSVVDNNGCAEVQCFALGEVLRIPGGDIDEGCESLENGSIDITVVGGIGAYVYSWEGPDGFVASTQDINSLAPGIYLVTVTSGAEVVTGSFTLNEPDGIVIAASITTADMGNNGAVDITPSGGTPPFIYLWNNGEETQDISMLDAGEYCVTVTDNRGCERSNCYTVESIPVSGVLFSTENVSCIGATDGTARIVISNGVAPFVASTTPGAFTASSNTDTITLVLPEGTFEVTVTDNQGGTFPISVTIGAPAAIVVVDTSIVSDTEDAECTGSITLMIAGGTGSYTVEWNLPSLSGPQVTGLCAGDYTATITDENGCVSEVIEATINQLTETAVATEVECEGDNSGTINLTVDGGIEPYSFAWRVSGETDVFATTEDVSGLVNGEYIVTIMDATGATVVRTYEVETAIGFSFTTVATSTFNGFNVSCNGLMDGSARINVSGTGLYTYEWFLGNNLISMDSVLTNAAAGTYTVSVLSDAGCEQFGEVTITEPAALSLQSSQTNISCVNERDGALSVQVSGGVAPFNYTWSNGSTLPQAQFLRAGNYSVIVTDANGCSISEDYTITQPEELVVTTEATDADDGCNGTITVLPLGGAENYNYRWPQLPAQGNNPVARGLCPGVYEIEIFDNNDCQTITVVTEVRDRRFPCLSERNVITPNGDGLNESFILFCTDGAEITDNELEIYNRWGQLVYKIGDYNCSVDGGLNCFEGRTNDGTILPEGPYYYVLDYFNPLGERRQKRGSITILLE